MSILAASTGALLGAAAINQAGNIANGQSAESNSNNFGFNTGQGSSVNDSYNYGYSNQISDAYGSAYGNSYGYGTGENWSEGSSWGNGENRSWNAVYGSEASAKDVQRAAEANAQQEYFARMQMAYNAQEAQKARDFEAMMSNTAYQRAMADLKAAGLNPILAAGNMGASTPSAAVASSGMASAQKATTYADQSGGSYGYNQSGSSNKSYGYNRSENKSSYRSNNESHSRGNSYNEGKSHGESNENTFGMNMGHSESKSTNNLLKAFEGVGNLISGFSSAVKDLDASREKSKRERWI